MELYKCQTQIDSNVDQFLCKREKRFTDKKKNEAD